MKRTGRVAPLCLSAILCLAAPWRPCHAQTPAAAAAAKPDAAAIAPLAPAVLGRPYHAQVSMAVAGTTPFTYMLAGDVKPPCLRLDPLTGILHGLPTRSCLGNYHLHVVATDYNGRETPADFVLHVSETALAPAPAAVTGTTPESAAPAKNPLPAPAVTQPTAPAGTEPSVVAVPAARRPAESNGSAPAAADGASAPAAAAAVEVPRIPRILAVPHDGDTEITLIGSPSAPASGSASPSKPTGSPQPAAQPAAQPAIQGKAQAKHALGLLSVDTLSTPCDPNHGAPLPLAAASGASAGAVQYTASTDSNGMVTLHLGAPLYAGEIVCPWEEGAPETPGAAETTSTVSPKAVAVIDPMDWGRVRAFFVGGILIANDDSAAGTGASSFSTAHEFLNLDLDKEWLAAGAYAHASPAINTYFDARLTSIPVASNPQLTAVTTSASASSRAAAATTATTSASGNQTEITSPQTARVSAGVYAPFLLTRWDWDNVPNALMLAPIAKIGFDTLTGPTQQNVISNNTATTLSYERVYNFYSFGGRVGHMALTRQLEHAPETLSYLDITMGRYSNLASYICHTQGSPSQVLSSSMPSGCAATYPLLFPKGSTAYDSTKRLYRLDIEGLLKIPHLPFVVGMNANIGQHALGAGHIDPSYQAPDDIRFLFGTRFDVGRALSRLGLTPSTGTKTKSAGE